MIPTRLKAKLPKHLSYPIGAEAVSEALAGAPHAEEFHLWFSDQAVWPASEFRRLTARRLPYTILKAEYRPARKPSLSAPNDLIASGWYDPHWDLWVYPVVRELRRATNRALVGSGLPRLADWLQSSGGSGWLGTTHRIEFVFRPAESDLVANESAGP